MRKRKYRLSAGRRNQVGRLLKKGKSNIVMVVAVGLTLSSGAVYAFTRPGNEVDLTGQVLAAGALHAENNNTGGANVGGQKQAEAAKTAEAAKQAAVQAQTQAAAVAAKAQAQAAAAAARSRVTPAAPSLGASVALYVNPSSPAASQAAAWQSSRPADAAVMARIASNQIAEWYGDWIPNLTASVNAYVSAAAAAGRVPLLVAYNIPNRDCGSYSVGGAGSAAAYAAWIQSFASGIGKRKALVVLEPDALAGMDCLNASDRAARTSMIADAVNRLNSMTSAAVYIDAGNSGWQSAATMAGRLRDANIASATGFALNVSNFHTTAENAGYGNALSGMTGGKHYVIDTSRNGAGSSDGAWCNPSGRAFGSAPTLNTGNPLADGFLWIKRVGESDGTCGGGPAAGQWWAEYALGLARTAGW